MFEKMQAPENVLAFRLGGAISAADIEAYREAAERSLAGGGDIGMCCDLTRMSDIEAAALLPGLRADLAVWRHIGRIKRVALISDKQWPGGMFGLLGAWLPSPEMRAFAAHEGELAVRWAAERTPVAPDRQPGMRMLATSEPGVGAFEIDGPVTQQDVRAVVAALEALMRAPGKMRMLGRITHFAGFDPAVVLDGGLLQMKAEALRKLERYAIVGAPAWMARVAEMAGKLMPQIEIRIFPQAEEAAAWEWIGAQPAG
jgi:hypothetical protein